MQTRNRKLLFIKNLFLLALTLFLFGNATLIEPVKTIEVKENNSPKNNSLEFPYLQKNFVGFKEALAFKESQGRYNVINTLGYLGKYQFGRTTLKRFRIYNTKEFLKNPELQEKAFAAYCSVNKWILRKDIRRAVGKIINGIEITESGILAAAHLGGAGNVKKYLRSNGRIRFSDAYGSSIHSYLKKFAGYNVSNIKADRLAKV
ncbi:peptidoglycan-binding protein LysM [Polaribacter sp.]|nr:peptidoglycan-binding protein LysM [Polaribacter sp.]MDC0086720.1 peptidoglycan-binding protein LysM [Polaribacter sp.]MDC1432110.1 peptidoglycan-binding protein LysM [Polaribacter sp.]MDC1519466.1 peptidoglycan-binding protein LysM [Polaribacter sp.]